MNWRRNKNIYFLILYFLLKLILIIYWSVHWHSLFLRLTKYLFLESIILILFNYKPRFTLYFIFLSLHLLLKLLEKFWFKSLFGLFCFHALSFWKWRYLRFKALMCSRSLRRFFRDCKFIYLGSIIIRIVFRPCQRCILKWVVLRLINFSYLLEIMQLLTLILTTLQFITGIEGKSIIFFTFITARRVVWKLTSRIYLFNFFLRFFILWKIINILTWTIIYWWSQVRIWNHDSWPIIELEHIREFFLIIFRLILFICHPWICILTVNYLWTFKRTFHSGNFFSWILHTDHFILRINIRVNLYLVYLYNSEGLFINSLVLKYIEI